MKLTNYLKEFQDQGKFSSKGRVNVLKPHEAAGMLQRKCKKAISEYKKGNYIKRWSSNASKIPYGYLDASKTPPRLSRNTLNYYTLIINDDPIWKAFPRRQVIATIMTTSPVVDNSTEWVIFPFDGVKIGVCQIDDMWDSFSKLKDIGISANRYNKFIIKMLNLGSRNPTGSFDKSLTEFKKACKVTDKWIKEQGLENIKEVFFSSGMNRSLKTLDNYNGDYYKSILDYYNPSSFKLISPGSYTTAKDYNEVWLEGSAIYVNSAEVEIFINNLLRGKND
jgi:hypothetical protein